MKKKYMTSAVIALFWAGLQTVVAAVGIVEGSKVAVRDEPFGAVLFAKGTGGYYGYRIPALAVTTKGTVLAFCEGRKNSLKDTGNIDLLVRRSVDGGKTWSAPKVIWDDGENVCGNPCVVVDRETDVIWFLGTWNNGGDHEKKIRAGTSKEGRRVFVMNSSDDGLSWSSPQEITADVKKPDWKWYATGPGSGIQLQRGKYAGRLVIPCDFSEGDRNGSHVFYSDDHGRSWQLGGVVPLDFCNECEVVELSNGNLMLNMRNPEPRTNPTATRARKVATSEDGGATWKDARVDRNLIEPVCQAAIKRYRWPKGDAPGMILFSNPAHATKRRNITVRGSYDDGVSWPLALVLQAGPGAYSDLAVLPGGDIGCLYEAGTKTSTDQIVFARFSRQELEAGGLNQ